MKKIKCILGFHYFKNISTQKVHGICGGFSESPLMRDVLKCEYCGSVKKIGYDIATNAHLNDILNWQPKLI